MENEWSSKNRLSCVQKGALFRYKLNLGPRFSEGFSAVFSLEFDGFDKFGSRMDVHKVLGQRLPFFSFFYLSLSLQPHGCVLIVCEIGGFHL